MELSVHGIQTGINPKELSDAWKIWTKNIHKNKIYKHLGKYSKRKLFTFPSLEYNNIKSNWWAYILGTYWSDGYASQNSYEIGVQDIDFIKKIKKAFKLVFNINVKIKFIIRQNGFNIIGTRKIYRIRVHSRNLSEKLKLITKNKLGISSDLRNAHRNNLLYLFIGIIDGDGDIVRSRLDTHLGYNSIKRGYIRISSPKKIMNIFIKLLKIIGYHGYTTEMFRMHIGRINFLKEMSNIGLIPKKQLKLKMVIKNEF